MSVKRLIVVLGLAGFIVMADNWVVSPLLPSIARTLNVEPARAGILIAAYMLPFGLFQLIYGPLADRFGKLRVVGISLVFFTVATGLCAAGTGLGDLTLYRALTGVFAAATMPISLALIGDLVPMKRRQQAIASFMGIAFLGQATSMTIGGTIAAVTSWRGVFVTYAVVAALITVVLLLTARSFAGELHGDPHSRFVQPYARLLGHWPSLRTYLVVFFEGVLILGSFSYLGANAARNLGLGTFAIGLLMAVFGVGVIAASRASARVAERIGRNRLVAVGLASAAAADLMVGVGSAQLVLAALGVLLLGLGFMFAHSSLLTTATQFAEQARGTAMSLVAFAFMIGGAIGTALGGRLIEATSYRELYLLGGLALLALSLIALVAVPQRAAPSEAFENAQAAPPVRRPLAGSAEPAPGEPRLVEADDGLAVYVDDARP
jgi:predicted MFS family arabinose efflux permease